MLGLALCGGGIKCAAHIGALMAFRRHGIKFDIIAGSSAGALVGALYAMDADFDLLANSLDRLRGRDIIRFTLARHGLGDCRRFRRFLRVILGDRRIEDLPRRLVVTAADLASGTLCLLETGDLVEAVYASCALPGVFKPLIRDDQSLADGSLLEPLPVAALRQRGARTCVGIYFGTDFQVVPAGPLGLMHRSYQMMMHQMAGRALAEADLVVQPQVGDCSLFDFASLGHCMEAGERAAAAVLPELQALLSRPRPAGAPAAAQPGHVAAPAAAPTAGEDS